MPDGFEFNQFEKKEFQKNCSVENRRYKSAQSSIFLQQSF